jgi:TetR/AcrR family transcriptional regulator, lmrAB and yxaGH operons repressor
MARQSDTRERMVAAARRLFRERGYNGTALSDVLVESDAPRGSVYYHFPGGKEEIAAEVTVLHAHKTVATIDRAAETATTAAELIEAVVTELRDELVASDYRQGCAVAPIVLEATLSSPALHAAAQRGFSNVITTLARHLSALDIAEDRAVALATHTVVSFEGALILSKVMRSPDAFDAAIAGLIDSIEGIATERSTWKSDNQ